MSIKTNLPCTLIKLVDGKETFLRNIKSEGFEKASSKNGNTDWYEIEFHESKAEYHERMSNVQSITNFKNESDYRDFLKNNYGEPKEKSSSDTK